jgi:hypothetical protein
MPGVSIGNFDIMVFVILISFEIKENMFADG